MIDVLNWMGDHPFLTVIVLVVLFRGSTDLILAIKGHYYDYDAEDLVDVEADEE